MLQQKRTDRWPHLFWVLTIFIVIMVYIWWGRDYYRYRWMYLFFLLPMLASNIHYKEGWTEIGLKPGQSFKRCFSDCGERLMGLAGLLLYFVWLVEPRKMTLVQAVLGFSWCLLWALAQQYVLNGFFVNRLVAFFGGAEDQIIPLAAALLFSLAHLPNLFLMMVTFAGGFVCAKIFLKYRNLYFLAFAQVVISLELYWLVPDWISYGFRIGPKILGGYGPS